MSVELTASSASVNRESDRQNAIMLLNVLGQYYSQLIQLMTMVTTPGVPPQLIAVGMKVIDAASEAVERTVRTFDQVRDPEAFVIRAKDVAQASGLANVVDAGMQQLMGQLGQPGGPMNGNGAPPQAPPQGPPPQGPMQ